MDSHTISVLLQPICGERKRTIPAKIITDVNIISIPKQ